MMEFYYIQQLQEHYSNMNIHKNRNLFTRPDITKRRKQTHGLKQIANLISIFLFFDWFDLNDATLATTNQKFHT